MAALCGPVIKHLFKMLLHFITIKIINNNSTKSVSEQIVSEQVSQIASEQVFTLLRLRLRSASASFSFGFVRLLLAICASAVRLHFVSGVYYYSVSHTFYSRMLFPSECKRPV